MTKRWVLVPRAEEGPEETYLVRLPGRRESNEGGAETEQGKVVKHAGPPRGGGKKMKGRPERKKKVVETPTEAPKEAGDVEMVDVDAATKEKSVPQGDVAREVEKREEKVEKVAVGQIEEGVKRHDLPVEAGTGDVEMGGALVPMVQSAETKPETAVAPAEGGEQKPVEGGAPAQA